MKKTIMLILALCMLLSLAGCGRQGSSTAESPEQTASVPADAATTPTASYTIKIGYAPGGLEPTQSAEIMYAETFKEYVEQATEGAVKVELYPSSSLGTENEVITAIAAGTVEMGIYDLSLLSNFAPEAQALLMPGAFETSEEVNGVIDSQWAKDFFERQEQSSGIKVLGGASKGLRNFTSVSKELKTVDDAKGMTFRVLGSDIYTVMVESLSATPVVMAGSEVYTAMQNGVIDGHENTITNILQDGTYEVHKYMVMDGHSPSVNIYYMSSSFFSSLPEEYQQAILDANEIATEKAREVVDAITESGEQIFIDAGMSIYYPTEEELAQWHAAYKQPCEDYLRGEIGDEFVDEMLATLDSIRQS